jgi:hypothetical protein
VHAGSGTGVVVASGGGAEFGRIPLRLGEHQPEPNSRSGRASSPDPWSRRLPPFSLLRVRGDLRSVDVRSPVGGMASGPAADRRPSWRPRPSLSWRPRSPSDGESPAPSRRRRRQCDAGAGERQRRTDSARTGPIVPLGRGELAIGRQRIVGSACERWMSPAALTLRSRPASPPAGCSRRAGPLTKGPGPGAADRDARHDGRLYI